METLIKKITTSSGIGSVKIEQRGNLYRVTVKPGTLILNGIRNYSSSFLASTLEEANYYFDSMLTDLRKREI